MRIFKYPLGVVDVQQVQLPKGAELLCLQLQMQHETPCLWALVPEPTASTQYIQATVTIHGTAHPIVGHPGKYLGTFQLIKQGLVFHAFIELP